LFFAPNACQSECRNAATNLISVAIAKPGSARKSKQMKWWAGARLRDVLARSRKLRRRKLDDVGEAFRQHRTFL